MKIIGSPTVTPLNPEKAGGKTTLKVTVTKLSDGSYGADHDPDMIRQAIDENRTVVCYWYDKNIMLHLSSFQLSGPYIFTVVEGAMEYRIVIRDTDDIVCTETNLLQEALLYTPQDLTPEQQAQALANLGLNGLPTGGGNVFDFTTTCPDAVKYFALTLPTTWDKIKMLNIHFNFGKVETPFNLYAQLGGNTRSLGEIAVGGSVGLNLFFVKNTANQLGVYRTSNLNSHASAYAIMGVAEVARYGTGSYAFTISSNTTGVPLPAGTTIEIWGVYE